MDQPESYLHSFKYEAVAKRDRTVKAMRQAGMTPIVPDSGYFIVGNFTTMGDRVQLEGKDSDRMDAKFSNWMIKNMRILALPMSNFYSKDSGNLREDLMRFSFVKVHPLLILIFIFSPTDGSKNVSNFQKDETLDKVVEGMTGNN